MTFSLKVDVDQKIQAVSTDVKTLSKSVSDLKQISTTIDTIEKQRMVLSNMHLGYDLGVLHSVAYNANYTSYCTDLYDAYYTVYYTELHFIQHRKHSKSPIQIVQNFKTMVGYERRITTDAMGKYYADKQSVQRKAIHLRSFLVMRF